MNTAKLSPTQFCGGEQCACAHCGEDSYAGACFSQQTETARRCLARRRATASREAREKSILAVLPPPLRYTAFMDLMALPFVSQIIAFIDSSKYFLFFFGALPEGPLLTISAGFLYRLGQVEFWPVYLALVAGDFVSDLIWYAVGYWGARPFFSRYGKYFDLTPETIEKVKKRFSLYSDRILIISKLTMGFGLALATLTVAGMLRVPFWRYAFINLACGFFWTLFLLTVGYFFGNAYKLIPGYLSIVFLILSIFIIFFGLRAASRYLARTE